MTNPSSYPEIISYLKSQIEKGKEAEIILRTENPILPRDILEKLVEKGNESQVYLEKFNSNRDDVEPKSKYYSKEYPSGPWSRALYQMRTGKPFSEEEFQKDHKMKEMK